MLSTFFHAVFYNPIYNVLVTLVAVVPWGDVGIAVILLTIIVRLVLLPFSLSAARTQRRMRVLEPKLTALKERYKDDKAEQAKRTLELYKTEKVNPFANLLTVFIQIPVLLALYWVFWYEPLTTLNTARLYSFTPLPSMVSLSFLGLIAIGSKSLILAFIAGATQYLQASLALSGGGKSTGTGMQADFTRIMSIQLRYVFPILIATIAYTTSAAIAIYFITTNLAGALQEVYVKRKFKNEEGKDGGAGNAPSAIPASVG